jgi:hypothetical protein
MERASSRLNIPVILLVFILILLLRSVKNGCIAFDAETGGP